MSEDPSDLRARIREAPAPRIVQRQPGRQRVGFSVVNGPKDGWRDVYHRLLTLSWPGFIGFSAAVWFAVNVLFALLYLVDLKGLSASVDTAPFWTAYNFSVETLGTIGYGAIYPKDAYTNFLVAVEAFTSIFLTAALTGVIFARVSRPTARVLFSNVALITTFDGKPTFMFRAANQRANQMLEAEVTLIVAKRSVTAEGVPIRRFESMTPVRARSPLFAISWTVMHVIDEASPLFGLGPEEMREAAAEVVVTIIGTDEVTTQRVHARHSYVVDELRWGHHFVDVVFPAADDPSRWMIDYARFHDTLPA